MTTSATNPLEQVLFEVKRTIVGQDILLERMAIGLLSGGHLLVEGVPGLAKTLAVKSLAAAIGGQFQRIQFTPDLVPADLTGTRVYRQHTGEFETSRGPVFTNLLLADEINRAPAKVQSALLEVMQERQVTIAGETHRVPEPFLGMATEVQAVATTDQLWAIQQECRTGYVDPSLVQYAVRLVGATRHPERYGI